MCNLYSMTKSQDSLRNLFPKPPFDRLGNLSEMRGIYPDYHAPIIREGAEGREMVMGRWGMPSPEFALQNKKTDRGVTNVRNTRSPHWRRWLGPENRCLVPLTSFAEPDVKGRLRSNVWFTLSDDRPAFFAGIWTRWTSVRKLKDGETTDDLYAFLTTDPNAEVAEVHPKAMPVILTEPEEWDRWLTAQWADVADLQRPPADGALVRL